MLQRLIQQALEKEVEGNQEIKSSQMNFGCRGEGRIEGLVRCPFVCSAQASVLDHSLVGTVLCSPTKIWAAGPANQAATSDQLTSTLPKACIRLPIMFAAHFRQNIYYVQTFRVSKAWFCKGPCMAVSWGILERQDHISRDRNPNEPTHLSQTSG